MAILSERISYKENFKYDFVSGLVVFLVAVPLCLGISLAAGTPLISGIIAGVVGGIVVGMLSESHVSVSGPSAGIIAVVIAAMSDLGSFEAFLLAVTLAGVIQILMGSIRAGVVAEYVPSHVIQGLLCAIGLLIIIKQLPLAFSYASDIESFKALLLETSDPLNFSESYGLLRHINIGALIISALSLTMLFSFDRSASKRIKTIPTSILVVMLATILNEVFCTLQLPFAQYPPQLVTIPVFSSPADIFDQLSFPDFHEITNPSVYYYALIIACVISLETLLNFKAAEKIDKRRQNCSKDKELRAQGIGNIVSGLLGGLPITSVVVRTSVNVEAGARSKMSTIFHGGFLLLTSVALTNVMNKIPLSALAAILIHVGFKLSHPRIFREMYRQDKERFTTFMLTVCSIVFVNLLFGIIVGLCISALNILRKNSQTRLNIINEKHPKGEINRLVLPQYVTFLNKASLLAELESIPAGSRVVIDATYSTFIDKEIIQVLKDFQDEIARHKHMNLNMVGFKDSYKIKDKIDFIPVTTYDDQASLEPMQVVQLLKEGNMRFLSGERINRIMKQDISLTAAKQHPIAVVLGCIDSRLPVETIFDMGMGDLFIARVAGNVVNKDIAGSVEYACQVAGAKLIVILGHTNCGAVKAACDQVELGNITHLLNKLKPAIQAEKTVSENRNSHNEQFVQRVTSLNIANSIKELSEISPSIQELIKTNEVGIVGAIYDVSTGEVSFKDLSNEFISLKNTDVSAESVSTEDPHEQSSRVLVEDEI